ncbi:MULTISPECIES: NB-ARC domain-containing protein [Pseudanabaena]|uniref:NB-ARC domain-containing protein n=2 Tax=Pseudanabaena TaxID=1152 RepID=L8MZK1_9CYAN|nr:MULTISPECIES: NB-ARC domain-containing protein [Pseudanabaena]ELS33397.1 hypothetical protein Pse7429DRAFT_1735 [Pseudanabaena biceps PCC 7429]MDG3494378.1 NB-ARC domain-containing protein [Pseudanabaena catenata USMAC16]
MEKQQFLDKFEELKSPANAERWAVLQLWLVEAKSDGEIAKALDKDRSTATRKIIEICKHFGTEANGKKEQRQHLVLLFRRYCKDFEVHPSIYPDWVDGDSSDRPQPSTNPQNIPIPTPESIPELTTLEFIGRDQDRSQKQTNLQNILITPDEIQDLLYLEEKVIISESTSIIENNTENMNIQQKINRVLDSHANASRERLYGIENYLEQLKTYLENKYVWLISVVGSGGVGKTSVVEKLVRDYGANVGFTDIVWVTAKRRYFKVEDLSEKEIIGSSINLEALVSNIATQLQITLPTSPDFKVQFKYLQNKLKQAPYLIIIDNLETLEEYKQLIQGFNPYDLSNNLSPSKIIMTSRQKLQSENSQLKEIEMKGIDRPSTVELIRYKGDHVERIAKATDEQLYPIFTVSDGIPLIILLIVNLIATNHQLTLSQIINKVLHEENLSSYLYFEALNSISDEAYNILRTLTGFSSNSSICYEDLKISSNLDDNDFDEAILELIRCSLLQNTCSLIDKPRYAIHSILFEFIKRSESE